MKNRIVVIVIGLLFCFPAFGQNCYEKIQNLKYTAHKDYYDLSFNMDDLQSFEISLYDINNNQYLIDNSNFQPFGNLSSAKLNIEGDRVEIKMISNQIKKEDLAVILRDKDNSCSPIQVELREL